MRRLLIVACVAGCATLASGCEFLGLDGGTDTVQGPPPGQPPPGQAPPAEPPPEEPPTPAPGEDTAEDDEYERPEYPDMARRNPFQPDLEVVQPADVPTEGEERTLEPLERFSLGELTLVAIISEVAVPKAMFIDPEGFGHVLKEGDRIGQNAGTLSDIRDNEVEITETTGEDRGKTRLRTMKLQQVEIRVQDGGGLTEDERKALEKLLATDEGRDALERQYRDMALGASAVDGQQPQQQGSDGNRQQSGQQRRTDGRFPGIQPPSGNQ